MKRIFSLALSLIMFVSAVFGTFMSVYAGDRIFGIDVSKYNELDFGVAKDSGKEFVMIKLGNYNNLDPKFWEHVEAAYDAQMDFGVYLYSYAFDTAEAEIEANFVIDTLSELADRGYAEYFTLPVAYDIEDDKALAPFGKSQLTNQMTTFCDIIKNAGYVPMVYTNLNWFTNYIDLNTVVSKQYKIWFANWLNKEPDNLSSSEFSSPREIGNTGVKADMWQYINGEKSSDGIDQNVIFDSDALIKQLDCYHSYTSKNVAATCGEQGYTLHTCSKCERTFKTNYIAKTNNHSYDSGKLTKSATTSAAGTKTYTCTKCGETKTETIAKIASATLSTTATYYTGTVKTPTVTVKDSKGKELKEGTDYTVTMDSGRINVGRYAVKVTYKGEYSGSQTLYFNVMPKNNGVKNLAARADGFTVYWEPQETQTTGYQIQYSKNSSFTSPTTITMPKAAYSAKSITGLAKNTKYYVRIRTYTTTTFEGANYNIYSPWCTAKTVSTIATTPKLSTTATYYTGTLKTPAVTVTDTTGKTLKNGTDYTVSYASGRKLVGRYGVTITYKGNYQYNPAQTVYFNIMPKNPGVKQVTASSKGFTVSWNTQTTQTTGYQIQYSTSSNFANAKTITMPKSSYYAKKVTGLTGNKKYYVRIRTYKATTFNGQSYNVYSPWCTAKTVTTKK